MDNNKVNLDFTTISQALKAFLLPEVDHIVGIANGGIVPASLIAHQINRRMKLIQDQITTPVTIRHAIEARPSILAPVRSVDSASCSWTKSR